MTGEPERIGQTDRRPRWRKKRWQAAGLLAAVIAYPVSYGPVTYGVIRGRVPRPWPGVVSAFYSPLDALDAFPPLAHAYTTYLDWWLRLALEHAGH